MQIIETEIGFKRSYLFPLCNKQLKQYIHIYLYTTRAAIVGLRGRVGLSELSSYFSVFVEEIENTNNCFKIIALSIEPLQLENKGQTVTFLP